jgi:hypothetical protein
MCAHTSTHSQHSSQEPLVGEAHADNGPVSLCAQARRDEIGSCLTNVQPLQAHLWYSQHPCKPCSCQQEQTNRNGVYLFLCSLTTCLFVLSIYFWLESFEANPRHHVSSTNSSICLSNKDILKNITTTPLSCLTKFTAILSFHLKLSPTGPAWLKNDFAL